MDDDAKEMMVLEDLEEEEEEDDDNDDPLASGGEREAMGHLAELAEQLCVTPGDLVDMLTEIFLRVRNGEDLQGSGSVVFRAASNDTETPEMKVSNTAFRSLLRTGAEKGIDGEANTGGGSADAAGALSLPQKREPTMGSKKKKKRRESKGAALSDGERREVSKHGDADGGGQRLSDLTKSPNTDEIDDDEEMGSPAAAAAGNNNVFDALHDEDASRSSKKPKKYYSFWGGLSTGRKSRKIQKMTREEEADRELAGLGGSGWGCGSGGFLGCGIIFKQWSAPTRMLPQDDRPEKLPAKERKRLRQQLESPNPNGHV
mmetsp:Transcript_14236/g.19792  ORF Transcript_14236/g.19792 Transcript_14236/m.19792 type:complete len:316 (+) Transcript_14236:149-1096(+)